MSGPQRLIGQFDHPITTKGARSDLALAFSLLRPMSHTPIEFILTRFFVFRSAFPYFHFSIFVFSFFHFSIYVFYFSSHKTITFGKAFLGFQFSRQFLICPRKDVSTQYKRLGAIFVYKGECDLRAFSNLFFQIDPRANRSFQLDL